MPQSAPLRHLVTGQRPSVAVPSDKFRYRPMPDTVPSLRRTCWEVISPDGGHAALRTRDANALPDRARRETATICNSLNRRFRALRGHRRRGQNKHYIVKIEASAAAFRQRQKSNAASCQMATSSASASRNPTKSSTAPQPMRPSNTFPTSLTRMEHHGLRRRGSSGAVSEADQLPRRQGSCITARSTKCWA